MHTSHVWIHSCVCVHARTHTHCCISYLKLFLLHTQGGGELVIVFGQGFPDGPKTILYVSPQYPRYSPRYEAAQENAMTLSVIIPSK